MYKRKCIMCVKKVFLWITLPVFTVLIAVGLINLKMIVDVRNKIISIEEVKGQKNFEYVSVLGALVRKDGSLSLMLRDRMDKGIEVFNKAESDYLILTGDGNAVYSETLAMSDYAEKYGIEKQNIIIDGEGYSTYESIYNMKKIVGENGRVIIISQKYHLYRSLFIAKAMGIDAYGVAAEGDDYHGQFAREIREVLARVKDFLQISVK